MMKIQISSVEYKIERTYLDSMRRRHTYAALSDSPIRGTVKKKAAPNIYY